MERSSLSKRELRRYQKHISLPEFGMEKQEILKSSSALVIGAGGLGAPVLQYLTAVGVGKICIVDDDVVNEHNLQRQILYGAVDIGKLKTIIARERLLQQNDLVNIDILNIRANKSNILELIKPYDIIIDATDNISTRYLLSDACILMNKPWIHGAIYKFEGFVSVFNYKGGPSYRCLYPEQKEKDISIAGDTGLLGVLPGIIGCIQATEAIKLLTGLGSTLSGKLFTLNILDMSSSEFLIEKNEVNFQIKELSNSY